jgi:predicted GH43/DUF377 family glycosyl hydrolase
MCAFNAGAALHDGRTVLLVRVAERPVPQPRYHATAPLDPDRPGRYRVLRVPLDDPDLDASDPRVFTWRGGRYLTSISHLRLATSTDGHNFTVAERPAVMPEGPSEAYGIEDPRICWLDGVAYVNYSAIAPTGVATSLARTTDFDSYEKLGIIFAPENKDIALFPEKIGGRYWCFHRPSMKNMGQPSIWLASSRDLIDWGRHRFLAAPRAGMWDCERVGCGPPPVKTPEGWLQFYHGADFQTRYATGALLLDLEEPWKIIARSSRPLMAAEAPYETAGMMPGVVFCNGHVERPGGAVDLYYGATDETTCGATVRISDVLDALRTGEL